MCFRSVFQFVVDFCFFICSHLSLNDFSQLSVTDISEMTPSACTHKRNIFLFFGTTKQIASHSIVGPIDYTQWIRRKAKSVRIFSIFLFFLLSDNNDGVLSSVYRTIHFVCVFAEHTDREYSGWTTAINITFIRQWWWLRTTVSTTTTTTTTTIKTTTAVCWPSVKKIWIIFSCLMCYGELVHANVLKNTNKKNCTFCSTVDHIDLVKRTLF